MYDEYPMEGIDDLLNFFNVNEISETINDQILNNEYSISPTTDYFKPYYVKYKSLALDPDKGITEAVIKDCRMRIRKISQIFIDAIATKYRLNIDNDWLDELDDEEFIGTALVLYAFFILSMKEILQEVISKYIDINHVELATCFEQNPKLKKDATFNTLIKMVEPDYAVIGSEIYDCCYLILDRLNEEQFIDLVDPEATIQPYIKKYFEDSHISGNFIDAIDEIMRSNESGLKNHIGFELIAYFKNEHALVSDDDEE